MSGLLCLKWNNHSPAFLKHLSKLRIQEHFCDATIVCHNRFFSVHKFVLSTCSEYFEEIFKKTQCKHPFIIVKDIQSSELEALLDYMYEGEVNVLQELLPGLIKAAECLKVKGLAVSEDDDDAKGTPQMASRKSKRDRKNANRSPVPHKRSRHLENSNLEGRERPQIQIPEVDILQLKEENEMVSGNYCETGLQNEDSNSNFNSKSDETFVDKIKLEPVDNNEAVSEKNDVEPTNEYSLNKNSSNSKDESLLPADFRHIQNFGEFDVSDANKVDEPQCSNWEGLINSEEGGDSNTSLEGFQDEIDPVEFFQTSLNLKDCLLNSENFSKNIEESSTESTNEKSVDNSSFLHCQFCTYKSRFPANIKRHFFHKHSDDKPFKCKLCPYRSAQKGHVKQHMRTHTGEKPFECPVCQFKAAQKNNMKRHIKTHSKEPFCLNSNLDSALL